MTLSQNGCVHALPSPDCWLHPDVEVRLSPIEGQGLFALARISVGATVVRCGGRLVSGDELRRLLADAEAESSSSYVDTIAVENDLHLIMPPGQLIHFGNHSCDPNLWWSTEYTLTARRTIEVDDELTNDYATSTDAEDFAMTCLCKATSCRGVITGRDWLRKDLQERYGNHWVPALLARISSAR